MYDDHKIVNTPEFVLKDKPGKQFRIIELENEFGASPDVIAVEKIKGKKNTFVVRAFIPGSDIIIEKT